jgi:drug/metabolite transporter (DMT)-like permease
MSNRWAVLVGWQICSLLLSASGAIVTYISTEYDGSIPFLMVTITYTVLLVGSCWKVPSSDVPWYRFVPASLLTIVGDYTWILAYDRTSMASALLFGTTVVFWVAPLSYFVFGRRLSIWQGLAILLALGGGALIMVAEGTEGEHWLGDVLALVSAICYALVAVCLEYLVHSSSIHLYLFRFSVVATPVALILCGSIEWNTMTHFPWSVRSGSIIVCYSIVIAIYDAIQPFIMQFSDATTMDLSLLTGNFFSLGISVLAFGQKPKWLYLVGFFCVPIAIAVFTIFGPKEEPKHEDEPDDSAVEGERDVDAESAATT